MKITQSELNQIKIAVSIFSKQPERLADLFHSGMIKIMRGSYTGSLLSLYREIYLFYTSSSSIFSSCDITINETQKYIAKLFNDSKK